jgi:leucyl/phenylalanyl-tRNA--protein transferase
MLTVLNPFDRNQPFPDPETALAEPNGLLAIGGCLSAQRLENAYRDGIFPWFGRGEPILWWSPDPRLVLWPDRMRVSRSLSKRLKRGEFRLEFDTDFETVINNCAKSRPGSKGTWISSEMKSAYVDLHRRGLAHSFEAWQDGRLVGGFYGVALGQVFFGESMFHRVTDASKAALALGCERLVEWGYGLIDCQVYTDHLASLGAEEIPRAEFLTLLNVLREQPVSEEAWKHSDEAS